MTQDQLDFLIHKLPSGSYEYCVELWRNYPFALRISKERVTKNGDYRFDPKTKRHYISVNRNLNPYAFLITYVHEVAHRTTFEKYGRKVAPHGQQWKDEFKLLIEPVMDSSIFPESILTVLSRHMKNPKASSHSDHRLSEALSKYDIEKNTQLLKSLETGSAFLFRKRQFQMLEKRRTRYVCLEINSGRKYLIPGNAEIKSLT